MNDTIDTNKIKFKKLIEDKREEYIKALQEENSRLNNIIGNIEKHLLNYLEEWEECKEDDEFVNGRCLMARDVLHDIHELKEGSDKE